MKILKILNKYYDETLDLSFNNLDIGLVNESHIKILLEFPIDTTNKELLIERIKKYLLASGFQIDFTVEVNVRINIKKTQGETTPINKIKNIIVVASGKGGVGKSTVSANISTALSKQNIKVGLLDADIYGPSLPTIMGSKDKKPLIKNNKFQPIVRYGVKSISIGNLVEEGNPIMWRGPIISNTLKQLITNTEWGDLDYLIIDLPPGTGDIQITITKKIPVTASIIITTPHILSGVDASRAINMFKKLDIYIAGIIENMSYYTCKKCNCSENIFESSLFSTQEICLKHDLNFLGSLPLDSKMCSNETSNGKFYNAYNDNNVSTYYDTIISKLFRIISKIDSF